MYQSISYEGLRIKLAQLELSNLNSVILVLIDGLEIISLSLSG